MCLESISEDKPVPCGFGWKVVFKENVENDVDFVGRYRYTSQVYKLDKWCKSDTLVSSRRIKLGSSSSLRFYPSGFHIYVHEKNADEIGGWGCDDLYKVKVEYRKAHTAGLEVFDREVIVAKEIRILSNPKPCKLR